MDIENEMIKKLSDVQAFLHYVIVENGDNELTQKNHETIKMLQQQINFSLNDLVSDED